MSEPSWATDLLGHYGYLGLALSLVVNCMGVPIASEITLPLSGVLVKVGTFQLTTLLWVAILGQLVGLVASYLLARYGGIELLERYGRYVFLRRRNLSRLQKLFSRHGVLLVLVGSCIPGLHGYMGYPAGLARVPFLRFLVMVVVGTVIWTVAFVGLGLILADHLDVIGTVSGGFGLATLAGLLLIGAAVWYHRRHV